MKMRYPPPWSLRGRGLVVCHRSNRDWRERYFPEWSGPVTVSMWVDYTESPVGPYREWLLVPGRVTNPRGRSFSISHIYVDSDKSLIGGRQNWGIPKEMAGFDFNVDERRVTASMSVDGTELALHGRAVGPRIPVGNAWWAPALYQRRDARDFWTRPRARGGCRWLRVDAVTQSGAGVPDVSGLGVLAAFYVDTFRMTFPPADIAPETA